MGNAIPPGSRVLVGHRDGRRCVRCLLGQGRCQWHHRRTRSVKDGHQHCPCVGILLCRDCHTWVHAHPVLARAEGWIVSRHETEPFTVPFKRSPDIWVLPACDGTEQLGWAESLGEAIEEFGSRTEVEAEVYNFTQEQP